MKLNININKNVLPIILLTLMVLLSACNTGTSTPVPLPSSTLPAPTALPIPTQTPDDNMMQSMPSVTIDITGVAQSTGTIKIDAVPSTPDQMWWAVMPEYNLLPLIGYPITDHAKDPQLFVYPVEGMAVNETAAKTVESLKVLLQDQKVGDQLPYLPLSSDIQIMHTQVKFLPFKNGTGLRFLSQLGNGMAPINNHQLLYTYQGLTSDGKYYISAQLPVYLPGLPMNSTDTDNLPLEFTSDYTTYVTGIVNRLNLEEDSAYTPDLSKLDVMMESIEVK